MLGGDAVHTSSRDGAPAVSSWLFSKGAGLGSLLTDQGRVEPEKNVLKLVPSCKIWLKCCCHTLSTLTGPFFTLVMRILGRIRITVFS